MNKPLWRQPAQRSYPRHVCGECGRRLQFVASALAEWPLEMRHRHPAEKLAAWQWLTAAKSKR